MTIVSFLWSTPKKKTLPANAGHRFLLGRNFLLLLAVRLASDPDFFLAPDHSEPLFTLGPRDGFAADVFLRPGELLLPEAWLLPRAGRSSE